MACTAVTHCCDALGGNAEREEQQGGKVSNVFMIQNVRIGRYFIVVE
jgi:hypothetical protein